VLAGAAPWLAVCVIALAWDVLGLDTGPRQPHLTISALSQAFRPLHAVLLVIWILVGIGWVVALTRDPVGGRRPRREVPSTRDAAALAFLAPAMCSVSPKRKPGAPAVPGLILGLLEGSNRGVGVAFWLGVAGSAAAIELLAHRSDGRIARAGELARFASRPLAARVFIAVAWGFAGWHLFSH
jgi:hypothetical protein